MCISNKKPIIYLYVPSISLWAANRVPCLNRRMIYGSDWWHCDVSDRWGIDRRPQSLLVVWCVDLLIPCSLLTSLPVVKKRRNFDFNRIFYIRDIGYPGERHVSTIISWCLRSGTINCLLLFKLGNSKHMDLISLMIIIQNN